MREVITTTANGTSTIEVLDFIYGSGSTPLALVYTNGTASPVTYYYVTNMQGDVVKLVNASGATVASYAYDAWGKVLSATGSMAEVNPIRYRGYYYDAETELYYLQSRYYDSAVKRFVNADGVTTTGQGFLGCNMFAYCLGSPISRTDPSGNCSTASACKFTKFLAWGLIAAPAIIYSEEFTEFTKEIIRNRELERLKKMVKDALAIAQTIYGEAGGRFKYPDEWQQGYEAVAHTIINRYNDSRYPDDWYEVVTAPNQFTGYDGGKAMYEAGEVDRISWDYTYKLAWHIVLGEYDEIPLPD